VYEGGGGGHEKERKKKKKSKCPRCNNYEQPEQKFDESKYSQTDVLELSTLIVQLHDLCKQTEIRFKKVRARDLTVSCERGSGIQMARQLIQYERDDLKDSLNKIIDEQWKYSKALCRWAEILENEKIAISRVAAKPNPVSAKIQFIRDPYLVRPPSDDCIISGTTEIDLNYSTTRLDISKCKLKLTKITSSDGSYLEKKINSVLSEEDMTTYNAVFKINNTLMHADYSLRAQIKDKEEELYKARNECNKANWATMTMRTNLRNAKNTLKEKKLEIKQLRKDLRDEGEEKKRLEAQIEPQNKKDGEIFVLKQENYKLSMKEEREEKMAKNHKKRKVSSHKHGSNKKRKTKRGAPGAGGPGALGDRVGGRK